MRPPKQKLTRAEQRAQLLAEAEKLIEQALAWTDTTANPDLSQIETIVLQLRRQFGQALAENMITAQAATQPVEAPPCGQCGQRMQSKGRKSKTVISQVGELHLDRTHYHCPSACQNLSAAVVLRFPPGSLLSKILPLLNR